MGKVINFNSINSNNLNNNNKLKEWKNKYNLNNNSFDKKAALSFGLINKGLFNPLECRIEDINLNDYSLNEILNLVPEKLKPIFEDDLSNEDCSLILFNFIMEEFKSIIPDFNDYEIKDASCPICKSKLITGYKISENTYNCNCLDCNNGFTFIIDEDNK